MLKRKGEKAAVGDVIGYMEPNGAGAKREPERAKPEEMAREPERAKPESIDQHHPGPSSIDTSPYRARPSEGHPSSSEEGSLDAKSPPSIPTYTGREEQVVPMTPIRRRIAERLVEAHRTAALLTTFNQVDMSAVIGLRNEYQERFRAKYQIKLGFMSFFIKACIEALK